MARAVTARVSPAGLVVTWRTWTVMMIVLAASMRACSLVTVPVLDWRARALAGVAAAWVSWRASCAVASGRRRAAQVAGGCRRFQVV